jgi:hypothetical protein
MNRTPAAHFPDISHYEPEVDFTVLDERHRKMVATHD